MKLILYNPSNGKYLNRDDNQVEDESEARVFDSILEADAHAGYYQHTTGVFLYVRKARHS